MCLFCILFFLAKVWLNIGSTYSSLLCERRIWKSSKYFLVIVCFQRWAKVQLSFLQTLITWLDGNAGSRNIGVMNKIWHEGVCNVNETCVFLFLLWEILLKHNSSFFSGIFIPRIRGFINALLQGMQTCVVLFTAGVGNLYQKLCYICWNLSNFLVWTNVYLYLPTCAHSAC